jgi:hypothetical protein
VHDNGPRSVEERGPESTAAVSSTAASS